MEPGFKTMYMLNAHSSLTFVKYDQAVVSLLILEKHLI